MQTNNFAETLRLQNSQFELLNENFRGFASTVEQTNKSSIFMYRLIALNFATRLSFARSLLQVIKGFFNKALLIAKSPSRDINSLCLFGLGKSPTFSFS